MNFKFKRLYHRVFSIFLVIVLSVLSVPTSAVAKEGNEEPLNISTSAPISESTIATDLSQEVIWPVVSDEEAMRREQLIQNGYSPDDYSASEYKQMAAKGELQPLAVYPAVLADGVYAIKNIGNSSGSTGFYLDTALAHWLPGYNMQQYKFENGTSPLDNFEVSTLFKITRNTEKGSYVIRIMRNNVLSFGIHVNSDGSNEILTKKIPLDDSEVALNDTYVITASGSGYYIRKYGTTNLIATKETTASGAAGAPDSYLYASTAIGDQTRWTFSAYTGPERNEMTMLGSGSLEVAKTSTLDPVFYSTRPGYNVVSLNMSQVPTSYYHLSGPSDYGIYSLTPHQGITWNVGIYLKNGSSSTASSILVKNETWNIALPIDEGIYFFENAQFPGKYMQIDDDSSPSTNGAIMELWDFDGDDDQRWNLDHISDGYYKITSVASGKALTMPTEEGASVTQTPYEETFDRLWYITENSNGTYSLQAYVFYLAAGDGIFTSDGRNVEGRYEQSDAKDEWKLHLCNQYAYVTLISRILYDSNIPQSTGHFEQIFNDATAGFLSQYNISFYNYSITSTASLSLDPNCHVSSMSAPCDGLCGALDMCETTHHRSADRILDDFASDFYYTCSFVEYAICRYDSTKNPPHDAVAGRGNVKGKNCVVWYYSPYNTAAALQHELSHNLGVRGHDCTPNQPCIMDNTIFINHWCDNHRTMIKDHIYN